MEWFESFKQIFEKCFIREDRYMLFVKGFEVTIRVSVIALILGVIIGFIIALCNLSKHKALRAVGKVYTDVIRGTPSVTQLMLIYFVVFASVHWPKWIIAGIAFGINSGGLSPKYSEPVFFRLTEVRRKPAAHSASIHIRQ